MHFVYIIYSKSADRYYVGESENVETRLLQHNQHLFRGSYTSIANDWELKLKIEFKSISHARLAEAFIKKMNSRKFIEKLLADSAWLVTRFNV